MNPTDPTPRPRLLFVGFNRQYVNRTLAVILRALQAHHAVDFFGPGFQPPHVLTAGPDHWVRAHGPYAAVVFESYVFEHDAVAQRAKPFAADLLRFAPEEFYRFGPALQRFVTAYDGIKVFVANFDIYGISRERVDALEALECHVICPPSRMSLAEVQAMSSAGNTLGNARGFWAGTGNDNWVTFVRRCQHRVIELPAGVGLEQFAETPLAGRRWPLLVPGTGYGERQMVYGLLTREQRTRMLARKVADRLYDLTHTRLSPGRLGQIQGRYDREIADSRMAFVSGSVFRRPVRKYFEVPALGALPIGQVCDGFGDLGFVDGQTFMVAETAADVARVLADVSIDEAQAVATRARRHVLEHHSEPARARQLRESLARIVRGDFRGGRWTDGAFHLL